MPLPQSPLQPSFKVPGRRAPFQVPQRAPMEIYARVQSLFYLLNEGIYGSLICIFNNMDLSNP
jgi:hypothetical protein